jgi:predicted nuclease of predicted toxin-antitoxin system
VQVSFLLDENIAAPLADKLDKAGHDVERIVDVIELGEGIDDTTICLYAVREGRLIVIYPGGNMRHEGRRSVLS